MEVAFVDEELVVKKLVLVLLVITAFVAPRLVVVALFAKKLVDDALVAFRLVIVPDAEVRSRMFALDIVVVARVVVPVTTRVPVVVALTLVRLVINPVVADSSVAKKLVDDALSKKELVA